MSETSAAVPRAYVVRPRRNWWRVLWRGMQVAPWVVALCLLLCLLLALAVTLTWMAMETVKTMTPLEVKGLIYIGGLIFIWPVLGDLHECASRFVAYVRRRAGEE
jgi:hypothetical protein